MSLVSVKADAVLGNTFGRVSIPEQTNTVIEFTVLKEPRDGASPIDPVDLTGRTIRFAAKKSVTDLDSEALFDVACDVTDDNNGVCEASIPGTDLTHALGAIAELSIWDTSTPTGEDRPDARVRFVLDIIDVAMQEGF